VHPVHERIGAPVRYLPEYLRSEPGRVLSATAKAARLPGFRTARQAFLADLKRDRTANRVRRFGQALVLAAELEPDVAGLHAHFLHTPASVARYTALLRGLPWSLSAHAKDIWTIPDWEKREKLAEARFAVTCTAYGHRHLQEMAPDRPVARVYHGLDLKSFDRPAERPAHTGYDLTNPVRILSVGRAVAKKGYDDLLEALADLPPTLAWRFDHVGGGPLREALQAKAAELGIAQCITWHGAQPRDRVIAHLREADLFVLASKTAGDGDRDGLPNVLLEAQAMGLPVVSTDQAGIPELVRSGENGILVPPGSPVALAEAIASLARDPARRAAMGKSGRTRIETAFAAEAGLDRIEALLREAYRLPSEGGRKAA
jgi:glycosyltransferase involved in cell wall biosynthesis